MRTVRVNTSAPYDILIERGLINSAGDYIKKVTLAKKVMVISDTNVEKLYAEKVVSSLEKNGFETGLFVYEAGEKSKTLDTISAMYSRLADFNMSRKDIIVAFLFIIVLMGIPNGSPHLPYPFFRGSAYELPVVSCNCC
jgi:3-dehydroquinate synthase